MARWRSQLGLVAQAHLRRLYTAAKALQIHLDVTPRQLLGMLRRTLEVNAMRDASGAYLRLVVSRGVKATPNQDPRTTLGDPTIAILPEWKTASPEKAEQVSPAVLHACMRSAALPY